MFMHFSCTHTSPFYLIVIDCFCYFSACLSLSLSLSFFQLVYSWHQRRASLLRPGILFVPRHLLLILLLLSGSMMIKPVRTFRRTFHNAAFIRNTKSFFHIFPILTFTLSSIVGVGSPFVTSQSLALRDHIGVLHQYARI